jgi:dolichol-phosphate mannosyltransferase
VMSPRQVGTLAEPQANSQAVATARTVRIFGGWRETDVIDEKDAKHCLIGRLRRLCCVFRNYMQRAPLPVHFLGYVMVGGLCAIANLLLFLTFTRALPVYASAPLAFGLAAVLNYWLCLFFLFRHRIGWSTRGELAAYGAVVIAGGGVDLGSTVVLLKVGMALWMAKSVASATALALNYGGRQLVVFRERADRER